MKRWISNVIGIAAGVLLALVLFGVLLFIAWAWITPSPYERCFDEYIATHHLSDLIALDQASAQQEAVDLLQESALEACDGLFGRSFTQCFGEYATVQREDIFNRVRPSMTLEEAAHVVVDSAIETCRHLPSGAFDQILW